MIVPGTFCMRGQCSTTELWPIPKKQTQVLIVMRSIHLFLKKNNIKITVYLFQYTEEGSVKKYRKNFVAKVMQRMLMP